MEKKPHFFKKRKHGQVLRLLHISGNDSAGYECTGKSVKQIIFFKLYLDIPPCHKAPSITQKAKAANF